VINGFHQTLKCKGWQFDNRATFQGRLVSAKTHAGPVRGLGGVGERIASLDQRHDKLVRQVGMAPAMPAPLREAEVRFLAGVIDTLRRVFRDALGQALGEVGALDALGNLRLRQLSGVDDQRLVLDQRPLDGFLGAIDINALPVLARGVEEAANDARAYIAVSEFDVRRLNRKGRALALDELTADGA
jgi:hypothetical protein